MTFAETAEPGPQHGRAFRRAAVGFIHVIMPTQVAPGDVVISVLAVELAVQLQIVKGGCFFLCCCRRGGHGKRLLVLLLQPADEVTHLVSDELEMVFFGIEKTRPLLELVTVPMESPYAESTT